MKPSKASANPSSAILISATISTTFIFCLIVFALISLQVWTNGINGYLAGIDASVHSAIPSIRGPFLTAVSISIDYAFDTVVMVIASLIISIIIWRKDSKRDAMFFALTMLADAIIVFFVKLLVGRARPDQGLVATTGFSFPSGHATTVIVFFGLLIYFAFKRSEPESWKLKSAAIISAAVLVPLTAFSRVYLGVHWLTDVIAGVALGAALVTGSILLKEHLENLEERKTEKDMA